MSEACRVTKTEWRSWHPEGKDVEVGDRRLYFVDGVGCLEGTVVAFDEDTVSFLPDGWGKAGWKPMTYDYEPLGITLEEADRIQR